MSWGLRNELSNITLADVGQGFLIGAIRLSQLHSYLEVLEPFVLQNEITANHKIVVVWWPVTQSRLCCLMISMNVDVSITEVVSLWDRCQWVLHFLCFCLHLLFLLCFTTIFILHPAFLTQYIVMCCLDSLSLSPCLPTKQRKKPGSVTSTSHYASLQLLRDDLFCCYDQCPAWMFTFLWS